MSDKVVINDYLQLAAALDLNDALTKLVEENDKNIAAVLDALGKYAKSLEKTAELLNGQIGGQVD